jgi:hypothetical protein
MKRVYGIYNMCHLLMELYDTETQAIIRMEDLNKLIADSRSQYYIRDHFLNEDSYSQRHEGSEDSGAHSY